MERGLLKPSLLDPGRYAGMRLGRLLTSLLRLRGDDLDAWGPLWVFWDAWTLAPGRDSCGAPFKRLLAFIRCIALARFHLARIARARPWDYVTVGSLHCKQ